MNDQRPRYHNSLFDSARWNNFEFRDGDIVICTPAKCGTTWTQMICALLIFQTTELEKPLSQYSPWLDMQVRTEQEVYDLLGAQQHRRFIKTHTPLDGLPINPKATYVCVGRDPRDAIISLTHHIDNMNHEAFRSMVAAATGVASKEPEPEEKDEAASEPKTPSTTEEWFWQWAEDETPLVEKLSTLRGTLHHYQQAFKHRELGNVFIMHYAAMKADLEGEMRRLASALQIEVPEKLWPSLVQAAKFENMRENAARIAPDAEKGVWKDARGFFYSGSSEYWKEFFTPEAFERYKMRADALAEVDLLRWAHQGSNPEMW